MTMQRMKRIERRKTLDCMTLKGTFGRHGGIARIYGFGGITSYDFGLIFERNLGSLAIGLGRVCS